MSATGFPRQPGTGHRQLHDIIERPKDEGAQVSVHHEYDQSPLLSRRVSASPRIQALQQSSAYVFPSYPSPIFEEDVPPAASAQAHSQQAKAAMLAVEGSPDELQVPEPSEGFIIPGSPVRDDSPVSYLPLTLVFSLGIPSYAESTEPRANSNPRISGDI